MKKILLLITFGILTASGFAQVVFYVYPSNANTGSFANNYATLSNNWDNVPDMTNPANNVIDTLAIVDDGADPTNDGCEALINGADIEGKIAMVWRGTCQFGTKAMHCEEAGAVAVIIVNTNPDTDVSNFGMLAGDDGPNVSIPVMMIDQSIGDLLSADINAGETITALIGNIQGAFANNVGTWDGDFIRFQSGANTVDAASLANDAVLIGAWVHNFGTDEMADVSLHGTITAEGSNLYDEVSTGYTIPAGDSVFVALPDFTGDMSNEGVYNLMYEVEVPVTDEFMSDNTRLVTLNVNESKFAACRVDNETAMPVLTAGFHPSGMVNGDSFSECIVYRESNASDYITDGLYFAGTTNSGDSLNELLITTTLYEWGDEFTDLLDPDLAFDQLNDVANGQYEYFENLQGEYVFVPFDDPFELEDNMRYLFCVTSNSDKLFLGFDSGINMEANIDNYLQPVSVTETNGNWFALGFGTDVTATIVANINPINSSVQEGVNSNVELKAFPNPANSIVQIPLDKNKQIVAIDIFDSVGKLVQSQTVFSTAGDVLTLQVADLANGMYSFHAIYEDGDSVGFKVLLNK